MPMTKAEPVGAFEGLEGVEVPLPAQPVASTTAKDSDASKNIFDLIVGCSKHCHFE